METRGVQEICAEYLGIAVEDVQTAASKAPGSYKRYSVRKRSGHGWRIIYHPARPTKALQYALIETLIHRMHVHRSAMAYRRGLRSPLKASALVHAPFCFSVHIDFKDFFPSIVPEDCFSLFERDEILGRPLTPSERDFIACTAFVRSGGRSQLAVGAPSSPSLSNAVMYDLDQGFSGFAEGKDGVYTRYADDLLFSCNAKGDCRRFVEFAEQKLKETHSPNLAINEAKTHFMSRATKRSITGLIVTPEGEVSIGRDRKRLVRSMVHRYKQYTRGERDFGKDRRKHLSGLLAFILDVEPDFYNRLVLKYGAETVNAALHARRRSR
jgi:hypothetical protein